MKKSYSGWDNAATTDADATMLRDVVGVVKACGIGCGTRVGRGTSYSIRNERIVYPSGFGCDLKEQWQFDPTQRGFPFRKCLTKYYGSIGSDKM